MGTTNSKQYETAHTEADRLANEAANKLGKAIGSKAAQWQVGGVVHVAAPPGFPCKVNNECESKRCVADSRDGKCA